MKTRAPESIDEYIDSLPANVQKILQKIRKTIQKAAPAAEEAISYQMPSFRLNGYLIYFAAHANHIGLYPAPRGAAEFKEELARYEGGKGTVQFKFDAPVPYDLIARIVKFRAQENMDKAFGEAGWKRQGPGAFRHEGDGGAWTETTRVVPTAGDSNKSYIVTTTVARAN